MSLMGIVDWLRKKIAGEGEKEPAAVLSVGHVTDEHRAEIETAKKEKEEKSQRTEEALREVLVAVAKKEKETGGSTNGFEESVRMLARKCERLPQLVRQRTANNNRKLRHRPMVRVRAHIKAERNARKMMCKRMDGSLWR